MILVNWCRSKHVDVLSNLIYGFIIIFGGLLIGVLKLKQKRYKGAYGGFGHFIGVLVAFGLAYLVSLEDSSKGISIMIFYPFFSILGIVVGRTIGKVKIEKLNK